MIDTISSKRVGAPWAIALWVMLTVGLAACSSDEDDAVGAAPGGDLVAKLVEDVVIVSPVEDTATGEPTTDIATTVFVPEHYEGDTYPLILHSHGWGGSRKSNESTTEYPAGTPLGFFLNIDSLIPGLVEAGYAVISFDERGGGDSGGQAKSMNPDFETVDAMAVLDWAESNLDLEYRDGTPLVGAMGGSYGGGFQHNLAMLDPRIDAVIPGATWYSLVRALTPNGVMKKHWTEVLCIAGRHTRGAGPPRGS